MKKIQRQTSFKIDWILVNELAIGPAPKNNKDISYNSLLLRIKSSVFLSKLYILDSCSSIV